MFSISVCMIVKNEECVLQRILECVKLFADEIIIVDTGSTDNTIKIAKQFTDNIYHFKWINDFASARNFSFSYATKDYIMWLDADDYITEENIIKIINLKKNSDNSIDVYMLKYIMGFENDYHTFEFYRERILKNNGEFKWEGFVHEVITPKGNIKYVDIEIEHRKEKHSNPKRNLNLYNKALKLGKIFTPREQYYYARELYYNNYLNKCEKELKKYLKMNDKYTPNILGAYEILSNIYLITNSTIKGKNILFKCFEYITPNSQLLINLAKFFEMENNIESAIFYYHAAIISPRTQNGFVSPDTHEFIPYLELCRLYYSKGLINTAKTYHNLAKKIHPKHPSIIYNEKFFK